MLQHPQRHIRQIVALCLLLITSIWIVVPALHIHNDTVSAHQTTTGHQKDCIICLHLTTPFENGIEASVALFIPIFFTIFFGKPVTPIISRVKGILSLRAPPVW